MPRGDRLLLKSTVEGWFAWIAELPEVAVTLPGRYAVSGAVRGAVTAIPGVVAVQDT